MLPTHPHFAPLAALQLHRDMAIEFHEGVNGRSRISFIVTDQMLTPAPALHAGYVYAACDLASYVALMSVLNDSESAVTHDLHISLMRTAFAGERVEITAEIVKRGRTLVFLDAKAMCGERLLATARITKSLM